MDRHDVGVLEPGEEPGFVSLSPGDFQGHQATPAKFVCNGKTFTAVQLSDIRTGANTPPAK